MKRVLRKSLVPLLCAVLLGAQHSALAHVLSHVGDEQRPANDKTLVHLKLCGKCVSAEKLSHSAPNDAGVCVALIAGEYIQPVSRTDACTAQESRRYNSRAPPHCL